MIHAKKQKSPRVDEEMAAQIKGLWLYSSLNQAQIAAELGAINQGRVSEVINGHRFKEVQPSAYMGWSK